jgi:hypothetical protein
MSWYRKPEIIISLAALTVSLCNPFVAYYWLQNDLRIRELKAASLLVDADTNVKACDPSSPRYTFSIRLRNQGDLPIDKLRVSVEKPILGKKAVWHPLNSQDVSASPPARLKVDGSPDRMIIVFEDPLSPHEEVSLTLAEFPFDDKKSEPEPIEPLVWVSSEVSSSPLHWSDWRSAWREWSDFGGGDNSC